REVGSCDIVQDIKLLFARLGLPLPDTDRIIKTRGHDVFVIKTEFSPNYTIFMSRKPDWSLVRFHSVPNQDLAIREVSAKPTGTDQISALAVMTERDRLDHLLIAAQ